MLDMHRMNIWKRQEVEKIIEKAVDEKLKFIENGGMPTSIEISEYAYNILRDYNKSLGYYKENNIHETLIGLKVIVDAKKSYNHVKIL